MTSVPSRYLRISTDHVRFSKHQRVIRLSYERYPFLANFSIAIRCNNLEILTLNFYKTIWNSNIDHMRSILEQDVCIHGKG